MTASDKTTVLITGANRGIGRGFVEQLLARPNHVVIATVRDVSKAQPLTEIPVAAHSRLVIVKIDATVENDAAAAVRYLANHGHPITHIDTVIANAAVCTGWPTLADLNVDDLMTCFKPNVVGIIWLYKALRPLLNNSSNPKWVTIGSINGSIGDMPVGYGSAAYGPTKAAGHWLTKAINSEEERWAAFVLEPGWVTTDMGNFGADTFGLKEAPLSVEDSVGGMLQVIDGATKESTGARFVKWNGEQVSW